MTNSIHAKEKKETTPYLHSRAIIFGHWTVRWVGWYYRNHGGECILSHNRCFSNDVHRPKQIIPHGLLKVHTWSNKRVKYDQVLFQGTHLSKIPAQSFTFLPTFLSPSFLQKESTDCHLRPLFRLDTTWLTAALAPPKSFPSHWHHTNQPQNRGNPGCKSKYPYPLGPASLSSRPRSCNGNGRWHQGNLF